MSAERRTFYQGVHPSAVETLVRPGLFARTELEHAATGVIRKTWRPKQVNAAQPLFVESQFDAFDLYAERTIDELGGVVYRRFDVGTGNMEVESARTDAPDIASAPRIETTYDGFGRVLNTQRTQRDPVTGVLTMFHVNTEKYDDGVIARQTTESRMSLVGNTWSRSETRLDGWGRTITTTLHTERGPETTAYTYDVGGNVASATIPDVHDDSGQSITMIYEHDSLGRLTSVSTPGLAVIQRDYFGNEVRERARPEDGSAGRERHLVTDAIGRLRIVRELTDEDFAVTSYDYDSADNVRRIINADGATTELVHDLAGHRIQVTRGDKVWTFDHDLNGNLEREQGPTPSGASPLDYANTYTYDDIDRQTSSRPGLGGVIGASGEAISTHGVTEFFYDTGCHGIQAHGFGRLCEVQLPFGTIGYGYTVEGWKDVEERALSQTWGYDSLGRVTGLGISSNAGAVLDMELAYWETSDITFWNRQ